MMHYSPCAALLVGRNAIIESTRCIQRYRFDSSGGVIRSEIDFGYRGNRRAGSLSGQKKRRLISRDSRARDRASGVFFLSAVG